MECPGMIEKEGQMKPMRKVKMLAFALWVCLIVFNLMWV